MKLLSIILIVLYKANLPLTAQKSKEVAHNSILLYIDLPVEAVRDKGIFNVSAAKTVLEMEAAPQNVVINETELLVFPNHSGERIDAENLLSEFENKLRQRGFEQFPSQTDAAFIWLRNNGNCFILYKYSGKKESGVYVGTANKLPDYLIPATAIIKTSATAPTSEEVVSLGKTENLNGNKDAQNNSLGVFDVELVGNWGTLNGPNISWQDESKGYMVVSGISKGHGLELKADGAYVQSTVVTSGRPNYRVYVSTTGQWAAEGDRLKFYPSDRHYRKWENEIIMIDEHSVPEAYEMFWQMKINEVTGKQCLYTMYESDSTYNELCIE